MVAALLALAEEQQSPADRATLARLLLMKPDVKCGL
jgi:hypothetical protein